MQRILNIYRFVFCRKFFHKFNYHLHQVTLRGIGVLNSEGPQITGESYCLKMLGRHFPLETIMDVGANTGEYVKELRAYFPKATIYAIEPHPLTFKQLAQLAKKNNIRAD